ncbi:MAG: YceD family protein [Pseudomonadota bacterium]
MSNHGLDTADRNAFPVSVDVSTLPKSGFPVKVDATETQKAIVAEQYGLLAVEKMTINGSLFRWRSKGARFEGKLDAKVQAACVVTEEPVLQVVNLPLDLTFVPDGSRLTKPCTDADGELVLDVEDADPPETFVGTTIDLGAVALELFSLELDPFPRAEHAPAHVEFTTQTQADADSDKAPSPFAALAALQTSKSDDDSKG